MYHVAKQFDDRLLQWIRHWPQSLTAIMNAVTSLGNPLVILILFGLLAAYGIASSRLIFVYGAVGVGSTIAANSILKLLFQRERPDTKYVQDMLIQTYSFPSGHSCAAMVGYGLLAYFAWKFLPGAWGVVVAAGLVSLIVCVGISRVYLGAHYPSDVFGGWIVGLIGLGITIFVIRSLS